MGGMRLPPGGRIADSIHGYVALTGLERAILDHPVAQRLRYVLQNGLAHLVFTEATTSRLSHSLGTMQVSSQFLSAVLQNSESGARSLLEDSIVEMVGEVAGQVLDTGSLGADVLDPALEAAFYCSPTNRAEFALAEQGLRLAALFHDLGHLPLSHDFEFGLEQYWYRQSEDVQGTSELRSVLRPELGLAKLHERVGHALALLLLRDKFSDFEDHRTGQAVRVAFELANRILNALPTPDPEPRDAGIQWLHSLVDGELDADRCDYILRDARNHGFEFASYDVARLLDNLVLVRKGTSLVTAVRPHGASAVESFFLARFRSYQYGVRHHKVAQVGAATRHSVVRLLEDEADSEIQRFRSTLAAIADPSSPTEGSTLLRQFAEFDDIWWLSRVREFLKREEDEWLELIVRRKRGPRSLWKRVRDFPRPSLKEWNQRLAYSDDFDIEARWAETVELLRDEGVLVVRHYFKPFSPSLDSGTPPHSQFSVFDGGELLPLTEISPLVQALWEAWEGDIQVQAFSNSASSVTPEGVLAILETALEPKEGDS